MSIYSSPLSSSEDGSQEEDLMEVGNLMSNGNLLSIRDLFHEFRVDNLGDMDGNKDKAMKRECSTPNPRSIDKYSDKYDMRPIHYSRSATPPIKKKGCSQNMKISAPRQSPSSAPISSSRTFPHLNLTSNSNLRKSKTIELSTSAPNKSKCPIPKI